MPPHVGRESAANPQPLRGLERPVMSSPSASSKLTGNRIYSCSFCRNHNAYHDDIISKAFQGRHGRAFLFNDVCNITLGGKEDRLLMTGLHTVRDVFCASCSSLLGWKYDFAYEQSQKYKEGKFIVEKAMVLHEGGW
uniref:Protein yippee-like n=1 Tax=Micromonas pusilla TaxID=38833 RepID=A0A7S0KYS4_MICPS